MEYSIEFQKLINDPKKFADIMQYNQSSKLYEDWELRRKFVSQSIDKNGTILDIGCAGGMLLRCLQEWSGYKLEPYGIDIIPEYIKAAQELLTDFKDHFAILDVRELHKINNTGLPGKYDFVFWNYLGPKYFQDPNINTTIKNVIDLASHRAIIGFYTPSDPNQTSEEKQAEETHLRKRVEEFKSIQKVDGELYNPTKYNAAIVWIDK